MIYVPRVKVFGAGRSGAGQDRGKEMDDASE